MARNIKSDFSKWKPLSDFTPLPDPRSQDPAGSSGMPPPRDPLSDAVGQATSDPMAALDPMTNSDPAQQAPQVRTPESDFSSDWAPLSEQRRQMGVRERADLFKEGVKRSAAELDTPQKMPDMEVVDPTAFGTVLKEGAKDTMQHLRGAKTLLTGSKDAKKDYLASYLDRQKKRLPTGKGEQKLISLLADEWKDVGEEETFWGKAYEVGDMIAQGALGAASDPKATADIVVRNLPNMVPSMAGMGAGAAAGGAVAGPVGAIVGGLIGMTAGTTAIESGAKLTEKLQERSPELKADEIRAALNDDEFIEETRKEGLTKGAIISGVDAISMGLLGKMMTGPGRSLQRGVHSELTRRGINPSDPTQVRNAMLNPEITASLKPHVEQYRKATSVPRTAGRGTAEIGTETVGEGIGELLGERAASGEWKGDEAFIESIAGFGTSLGQAGATAALVGRGKKQQAGRLADQIEKEAATAPDEELTLEGGAETEPERPTTEGLEVEEAFEGESVTMDREGSGLDLAGMVEVETPDDRGGEPPAGGGGGVSTRGIAVEDVTDQIPTLTDAVPDEQIAVEGGAEPDLADFLERGGIVRRDQKAFPTRKAAELKAKRSGLESYVPVQVGKGWGLRPQNFDEQAHQAATSPTNDKPEPTQAQKEAGNYEKGHPRVHGLETSIENPKGSTREGTDRTGRKWSQVLKDHYGYIRGTVGADSEPGKVEQIDAFFTDQAEDESRPIFVIDQKDPQTGKFDEHKVVIGAKSETQARSVYKRNYEPGWKGLGAITKFTPDELKQWLSEGDTKKAVAMSEPTQPEAEKTSKTGRKAKKKAKSGRTDDQVAHSTAEDWMDQGTEPATEPDEDFVQSFVDDGRTKEQAAQVWERAREMFHTMRVQTRLKEYQGADLTDPEQRKTVLENIAQEPESIQDALKTELGLAESEETKRPASDLTLLEALDKAREVKLDVYAEHQGGKGRKPYSIITVPAGQRLTRKEPGKQYDLIAGDVPQAIVVLSRYYHGRDSLSDITQRYRGMMADQAADMEYPLAEKWQESEAYGNLGYDVEVQQMAPDEYLRAKGLADSKDKKVDQLIDDGVSTARTMLSGTHMKAKPPHLLKKGDGLVNDAPYAVAAKLLGIESIPVVVKAGEQQGAETEESTEPLPEEDQRTAERDLWREMSADTSLWESLSNKKKFNKALRDKLTHRLEADADLAYLLKDGKPDPEVFDPEFYAAVRKEAQRRQHQADLAERRENWRREISAWLEESFAARHPGLADNAEAFDDYKIGYDHAINGGTLSNLPTQGEATMINSGYKAAADWLKTEDGKAFARGVKNKKQKGVGEQLKRIQDMGKESDVSDQQKQLTQIMKLTARADLFSPKDIAGEGATPGVIEYLSKFRDNKLMTFKEFYGGQILGGIDPKRRHRWSMSRSFSEAIDDNVQDNGLDEIKKYAEEYIQAVQELANLFDGVTNIDEAVQKRLEPWLEKTEKDNEKPYNAELMHSFVRRPIYERDERGQILRKDGKPVVAELGYDPYTWLGLLRKNEDQEGSKRKPLRRPSLDVITRSGFKDHRKNRNVTAKDLKDTFGFAGVTLGKSPSAKKQQDHLNYAFDAFHALAEQLGLKPKDISFGGTLYLAFGALGRGRHAAHYSPNHPLESGEGSVPVINLTNTQGDGSVSHEWFHALDWAIRKRYGIDESRHQADGPVGTVTELLKHLPLTEEQLNGEIDKLLGGSMYYKGAGGPVRSAKMYLERIIRSFDQAKRQIQEQGPEHGIFMPPRYGEGFKRTDYYRDAKKLGKDYWGNAAELFARAGEAYVYDKAQEAGKHDDYLVTDWVSDGMAAPPTHRGTPYPRGEERQRVAMVFDELFKYLSFDKTGPKVDHNKAFMEDWIDERRQALSERHAQLEKEYQDMVRKEEEEKEAERQRQIKEEEERRRKLLEEVEKAEGDTDTPAPVPGQMSMEDAEKLFDEVQSEWEESQQDQFHTEQSEQEPAASLDLVAEAYRKATGGEWNVRAKLSDVRPHLSLLSRQQQDDLLLELQKNGDLVLYPNDDPRDITGAEADAAIDILGAKRHLMYMKDPGGKKAGGKKKAGKKKASKKQTAKEREISEITKSFAGHSKEAVQQAAEGLYELFGGNSLKSFPAGLDEATYRKAKPHFDAMWAEAKAAGEDLKDFIRKVLEMFGPGIKPYAVYWMVHGADDTGPVPKDEPETDLVTPEPLVRELHKRLVEGTAPRDNKQLRALATEIWGRAVDDKGLKQAQEAMETALVMRARDLSEEGGAYQKLVDLYENQPNLSSRTSTSVANQAYSTPAPLAYVAQKLARIDGEATVYEPSAGNGALLTLADPQNATVNELDADRALNLKSLGFRPIVGDANTAISEGRVQAAAHDVVIANPPFGKAETSIRVDGYKISQIDHQIAARALMGMKSKGRAVLILGAQKHGGMSEADRVFFNWLYSHYNVADAFEVAGELYQRQGAGWPVRVMIIAGRNTSESVAPSQEMERVTTWSELYERHVKALSPSEDVDSNVTDGEYVEGLVRGGDAGRQTATPRGDSGSAGDADTGARGERPGGTADGRSDVPADGGRTEPAGSGAADRDVAGGGQPAGTDRLGDRTPTRSQDNGDVSPDQFGEESDTEGVSRGPAGRKVTDDGYQIEYVARSKGFNEDILSPINMADAMYDSLEQLEKAVGKPIDEYVQEKLGYQSQDEMFAGLMGLQVDAVGAAIYNMEKGEGIIIADQTGVGKGRQAAAIIRYARQTGRIPVFVTEKRALFTDMYRDLLGVGEHDVVPFMMNREGVVKDKDDNIVFSNAASSAHNKRIRSITSEGALPEDTNALFMTYSQVQDPAKAKHKMEAVEAIADKAIFILDESHNSAGVDSNTFEFFQEQLERAAGVTYLSATYAKRADNMPIYFKTSIDKAVGSVEELVGAMKRGGNQLQTIVSNMLARSGQLFRRERSFDGITTEAKVDEGNREEHRAKADELTSAIRVIVDADRALHESLKGMHEQFIEMGFGQPNSTGNKISLGLNHAQYTAVVHNQIRQMLVAFKADAAADEAIESLKRGEKPVIALMGTMGSFLDDYVTKNDISTGEELVDYDFRQVLHRSLERTRNVSIKDAKGNKIKFTIPWEWLPDHVQAAFNMAAQAIDELAIDAPISPIDWIRYRIEQAGYSIKEITGDGRDQRVDYGDPKAPRLAKRDKSEKDRNRTISEYNRGELDVIIANKAGVAGISLHASEDFVDNRQRHMVFAEPFLDINDFVQMMGRINRTGQITEKPEGGLEGAYGLPHYTILNVSLPAETRPTSVLLRKLKSLNANVSSNTESATSFEALDFLNKYGDEMVANYLRENRDVRSYADLDPGPEDRAPEPDLAMKASGRLAIMPVTIQDAFYEDVGSSYKEYIEYLDSIGQNDLKVDVLDLKAKPIDKTRTILTEGEDPTSEFGRDSVLQRYNVNVLGHPPNSREVEQEIQKTLKKGKLTPEHIVEKIMAEKAELEKSHEEKIRQRAREQTAKINELEKEQAGEGETSKALAQARARLEETKTELSNISKHRQETRGYLERFQVGSLHKLEIGDEKFFAVVTDVKNTAVDNGTSPYADSKTSVSFMVNGGMRTFRASRSRLAKLYQGPARGTTIEEAFDVSQTQQTEQRWIATGNLIAAFTEISSGRVATFSTADGRQQVGIVLPKKFDPSSDVSQDVTMKHPKAIVDFLHENRSNTNVSRYGLGAKDQIMRIMPVGSSEFVIQVPQSKSKGGKWYLDKKLTAITGDFASHGGSMRVRLGRAELEQALERVILKRTSFKALASMASIAKPYNRKYSNRPDDEGLMSGIPERARPRRTGMSVKEARDILAKRIGRKTLRKLERSGEFAIRARQDQVEAVQRRADKGKGWILSGMYDPQLGKTSLIAENLTPDQVYSVFLHEYGAHFGLKRMIGDKDYEAIKKQLQRLGQKDSRVQNAINRVPRKTSARYFWDEVLAYLVEHNHEYVDNLSNSDIRPGTLEHLIRKIIAKVRAFMAQMGIVRPENLRPADIVELVRGAAKFNARRTGRPSITGIRIHGEEELAKINTATENFKRWFRDSVVVDDNGEPRVMYHGTRADFDAFAHTKDMGFHVGTLFQAMNFVRSADSWAPGGNIIPVYVSIQSPIRLPDLGNWKSTSWWMDKGEIEDAIWEQLGEVRGRRLFEDLMGVVDSYRSHGLESDFFVEIVEVLDKWGFDGVVYKNTGEGTYDAHNEYEVIEDRRHPGRYAVTKNGRIIKRGFRSRSAANEITGMILRSRKSKDSYIAFLPGQLKSSVGNRGTFDPNDPNMLHSMRPAIAANLSAKGTAQSYAKQLRDLVKQGALTREQLDRSGLITWLEGFKLRPTYSERLDEQFLDIPAQRSLTISKKEITQFLASEGLMSGKRKSPKERMRDMGIGPPDELEGDDVGNPTRPTEPVDEIPEDVDTGTARNQLRDQGFESPDDEGMMSGYQEGVDYDTPEQLEALRHGGFGDRGPKKPYRQQFEDTRYRWTTKLRQGLVDQFAALKDVLGDKTAWMMAQISKAHTGVLEAAVDYGRPFLDRSGAIDVDVDKNSLKELLSPLGPELNRWLAWVAGNRAEKLKTEDRERLFSDEHIAALKTLNQGRTADGQDRAKLYEAVRREYEALNQSIVQIAVDTGLVNDEEAQIWAQHGFYVPFYRMVEEAEAQGPRFVGALVRQTGFKRLKGADIPLDDLLGNILSNWNHLISASLNNQAAKQALDSAVNLGMAEQVHRKARNKKSSVWIRENGRKVYYNIEDSPDGKLVFQALEALSWDGFNNPAMKAMRKFKRALTIGVTASPEFRIANLFRDTLHSAAVVPVSPNIVQNLYRGFKLTNPKSRNTARMIAGGGRFGDSGYIHGTDPEAVRMILKKAERDTVLDTRRRIQKMWDWWQDTGARAENVNRAAAFEKVLRDNPDNLLLANFEARDLLDFSRSGAWPAIRFLTQVVPFLNARMQGLDKLGRGARNQTGQFSAVVGVYALASVMLYLYMRDDEDFEQAEEWEKDTYHIFKLPGSEVMYRLPRPFEVGVIGTMMERFTEQMVDDKVHGELFAERLWHALTQTLSFNPTPQAFQPMLEIWGNRDMFTDRPIESKYMENLSPTERKRAWTSETAIGLSQAMGATIPWEDVVLSPVQVEHLVQGYLGWGGAAILGSLDMLVRPATDAPSVPTRRLEDMPVIGRFVREAPKRNSKFVTQFYDNLKQVNQAYNDIRQARELRDFDRAEAMAEEYSHLLPSRRGYNRARTRLSQINKAMTMTRFNKNLSREEKRRRLDELTEQKNLISRQVVEQTEAQFR